MIIGEIQKKSPPINLLRSPFKSDLRIALEKMVSGDYIKIECDSITEATNVMSTVYTIFPASKRVMQRNVKIIELWVK